MMMSVKMSDMPRSFAMGGIRVYDVGGRPRERRHSDVFADVRKFGTDVSDIDGAHKLARAIERFWAAEGYDDVVAIAESVNGPSWSKSNNYTTVYRVRTNLKNGLPPSLFNRKVTPLDEASGACDTAS